MVRGEIGRKDLIKLVADTAGALASFHIPEHALSGLSAQPSPRKQQLAVTAEANDRGKSLRERQHSERLQRFSVIKDDLLLTAHSRERCPRAGRQRYESVVPARLDKRLERQVPRHGWRPRRLFQ